MRPLPVCPVTRLPLQLAHTDGGGNIADVGLFLPAGATEGASTTVASDVLLRSDQQAAYPIINGHPVLLEPEMLSPLGRGTRADIRSPVFAEAYADMAYYRDLMNNDQIGAGASDTIERLRAFQRKSDQRAPGAPLPALTHWLEPGTTVGPAAIAYEHLAPKAHGVGLQIGGRGTHAIKFLIAGARHAVLLSPVIAELDFARYVADEIGLGNRLTTVCGIAEQIPFGQEFDVVYSGSSLHHTVTGRAAPEIHRVISPGGRFASVDIFRSPLYDRGIRVFGRATAGASCRPLDAQRLQPVLAAFPESRLHWTGRVFRYPVAAAQRLGVTAPVRTSLRLERIEDSISRLIPTIDRMASVVVVTAQRN